MHIVIPGSLPPHAIAAALAAQVESSCPALLTRLRGTRAQPRPLPVEETGCTALEALELYALGYGKAAAGRLGAGLGPLRAGIVDPSESVWIAELSSVAIGREGAALLSPDTLEVTAAEADALYEAVAPLWAGSGFSALPLNPARWRIWLPTDAQPITISPAAVAGRPLEDWWPAGEALRPWRRLSNEIQMTWHEHAVNVAREARGLPPINGLWLYGGAKGWRPDAQHRPHVIDLLSGAFARNDWGDWVAALPALSQALEQLPAGARMTLLGEDRAVELEPARGLGWRRLLPGARDAWKTWWKTPD